MPASSSQPPTSDRPRILTKPYAIDDRVKRAPIHIEPKRRPSLWAKIGGALSPSELLREYANVRKYQEDVDRLVRAGWNIEQQVDRPEKIVVRWFREPTAAGSP